MIDDRELLRRYAEDRSETAFAELVRRRLDFVYACALRRVGGDAGLAEDVAQVVFAALAQQARTVARHASLTGWLFTTARYASAQVVRGERRRHAREQEAHTMMSNDLPATGAEAQNEWERLRPVLDAALDQLGDRDREAVLMRFFEQRSFAEVGEKLRLTENAARMRVERALDKLHGVLAGRGVRSTSAALGLALAAHSSVAAPTGLAAAVTGTALAGGAATAVVGGSGAAIFGLMSATKLQVGLAAAIVLAGTGLVMQERNLAQLRHDLALITPAGVRFGPEAGNSAGIPTVVQAISPQDAQELERLRTEITRLRSEETRLTNLQSANQESIRVTTDVKEEVQPRNFIKGGELVEFKVTNTARLEAELRLAKAESELAVLSQRLLPAHPTMRQKLAEIEAMKAVLGRLVSDEQKRGWF